MNLTTLSSYKFGNYWLSVTREGKLQAIKKEHFLLRLFKTILGKVLHSDFYSHIHLHTVLSCIEKRAIQEKESENVCCYLRILSNLKQALPVKKSESFVKIAETIQRAHPEIQLSYDKIGKWYKVPQTDQKTLIDGARAPLQDQYANHYIGYRVHLAILARIPSHFIADGAFSKVEIRIPSWKILTRDPLSPITGSSACYVSDHDIRTENVDTVDVLVEDQEAQVSSDGIARFPNGRVLEINKTYFKTFNTTFKDGLYDMHLIADFSAGRDVKS